MGVSALGTAFRMAHFLARFSSGWPEMFCYYPDGRIMFELASLAPIAAAAGFLAVGVLVHRESSTLRWVMLVIVAVFGVLVLLRVNELLAETANRQYDAGCAKEASWAFEYPLLTLMTQHVLGYAVTTLATLAFLGAAAYEWRRRVA